MTAPGPILFAFETIDETLELMPLAARRALDHAGLRLPLAGWQSLSRRDRMRLCRAGADDRVNVRFVRQVASAARPSGETIEAPDPPDPRAPPERLVAMLDPSRPLEASTWMRLRELDRFALMHEHVRSVAKSDRERMHTAYDVILGARARVPSPPFDMVTYRPAGAPSSRAPRNTDAPSAYPSAPPAPRLPGEMSAAELSHLDEAGRAHMVDVGAKAASERRATATGAVRMSPTTAAMVQKNEGPKGEVLSAARIAGIMAAKRTPELIPLCHQVHLTKVSVHFDVDVAAGRVGVTAVAKALDRTGVEMEALVAVSVACLTIYDMLKAVDRSMVISGVELLEKLGGVRGPYKKEAR